MGRDGTRANDSPLTRRSAVNERNRERGCRNDARDAGPTAARPGDALSGCSARAACGRKPLRMLVIERQAPGSLRAGVLRELVGRRTRDRSLTSPSRTRTYNLAVNSRSLCQLSYRGKLPMPKRSACWRTRPDMPARRNGPTGIGPTRYLTDSGWNCNAPTTPVKTAHTPPEPSNHPGLGSIHEVTVAGLDALLGHYTRLPSGPSSHPVSGQYMRSPPVASTFSQPCRTRPRPWRQNSKSSLRWRNSDAGSTSPSAVNSETLA